MKKIFTSLAIAVVCTLLATVISHSLFVFYYKVWRPVEWATGQFDGLWGMCFIIGIIVVGLFGGRITDLFQDGLSEVFPDKVPGSGRRGWKPKKSDIVSCSGPYPRPRSGGVPLFLVEDEQAHELVH